VPWDLRTPLVHGLAHPLVNLSYAIDRGVDGFSSFGYHVTNGVLHVIVVGLFYGWCTRAFADRGQTGDWAAFFAAAIFGVHPLMGTAAGYVSARTELIGALAFIAALMFARRAIVRSNGTSAAIAAAFGAGAIASSRAAAALPLVVLVYDAWVLRAPKCRWRVTRIYAPAMAFVVVALSWHLRAALAADPVPARGMIGNLLTESIVAWRYVALLLVPYGQSPVHDVHWATGPADFPALIAAAAMIGVVAAAIRMRESAPLVAFGVVWFVATLAPTTSVVPLRDAMAEPRMYLPGAGLLLAAASVLWRPLACRPGFRSAGAVVLVVLGLVTYTRNRAMANPRDVWREAARRAPHAWQAHLEYAESLREAGRCDEARAEYEAARALNGQLATGLHLGAPCASAVSR
jgi:protein O-mannosyl-transferase